MEWKASANFDPISGMHEIRLAIAQSTGLDAAIAVEDGHVEMTRVSEGAWTPPFLRLPHAAVVAIQEALEETAPPASDADLREALAHERGRVDLVINRLLGDVAP